EDLDSGKPTRRSSERREKPWWRFWRKSFEFREAICQPLVPPPGAMSSSKPSPVQPPRVFINYSHDSPAHCDWILSVAQQLRRDGIDVELDQFHQEELVHWPRWGEEQLRPGAAVLFLCL